METIRVEFYEGQTKIGEIIHDDKGYSATDDRIKPVLTLPIWTLGNKKLQADSAPPEQFMENLRFNYKTVYFKAGPPIGVLKLPEQREVRSDDDQVAANSRTGKEAQL